MRLALGRLSHVRSVLVLALCIVLQQPTTMLVVVEGAVATTTTTTTCSVCGSYGPSSTPFPDKRLPEIAGPLSRCLDLEEASLYVGADTQLCEAMRALGPYCGCNTPPDACSLCWDGSLVTTKKNLTLPNYQASDFINTYGYDLNMTCETMEAFLPTIPSSNTEQQCLSIDQMCCFGERLIHLHHQVLRKHTERVHTSMSTIG